MPPTSIRFNAARLVRTVRYLTVGQIAWQVHRRVRSAVRHHESARGQADGAYPGCVWPRGIQFLAPGAQNNTGSMVRDGSLCFLNRRAIVGFPPQWHCPHVPKLWQYNLHYLEWLWALDYGDARSVVVDWIDKYPVDRDAVGWGPYPTSLRLINWCALFWGRWRERTEADGPFLEMLWKSICRQAEWLMRHLEKHLLGNHYLENGAALSFAGSCFSGEQARRWFAKGGSILRGQIPKQILADGTHFELSPMYHCRMTYVLALLAATGNGRLRSLVVEPLSRMMRALDWICHPDGRIALLNDSAFGVYPEPSELRSYGRRLLPHDLDRPGVRDGCFALESAGYYGWRGAEGTYLIADFGKNGPDYALGHAHADIFSFELSVRGRRMIVDSGVSEYEASTARSYCRSTAAHNTLEVEDQDQSEMWAAFRVARRGYLHDLRWEPHENGFELSAWHDGYRRLRGDPVHTRTMLWEAAGGLKIVDHVRARRPVRAVSRLHLHPSCSVAVLDPTKVRVSRDDSVCTIESTIPLAVHESFYCPEFGIQQVNPCVCATAQGAEIEMRLILHCARA